MATVGRNDPCPCGSGKKYKKCHMEQDEQRGRELRNLAGIREWLGFHLRRVYEALSPRVESVPAVTAAAEGFFIGAARPSHPLDDTLFRDHALFDVPAGDAGDTLLSQWSVAPELASSGDTETLKTALEKSYLTLLEVTEVKRGKGVGVRDRLTETEVFIWDEHLALELEPMEVILGRRLPFTDRPLIVPGWRKLVFHGRKKVIAAARAELDAAGLDADDMERRLAWHKAAAPRLVALARSHAAPPSAQAPLPPDNAPADAAPGDAPA